MLVIEVIALLLTLIVAIVQLIKEKYSNDPKKLKRIQRYLIFLLIFSTTTSIIFSIKNEATRQLEKIEVESRYEASKEREISANTKVDSLNRQVSKLEKQLRSFREIEIQTNPYLKPDTSLGHLHKHVFIQQEEAIKHLFDSLQRSADYMNVRPTLDFIEYGDLNGDGYQDVAFISYDNPAGGTGTWSLYLHIYLYDKGFYRELEDLYKIDNLDFFASKGDTLGPYKRYDVGGTGWHLVDLIIYQKQVIIKYLAQWDDPLDLIPPEELPVDDVYGPHLDHPAGPTLPFADVLEYDKELNSFLGITQSFPEFDSIVDKSRREKRLQEIGWGVEPKL